jgi:hypothetical protein
MIIKEDERQPCLRADSFGGSYKFLINAPPKHIDRAVAISRITVRR